jgi:hypothetical protein
MFVATEPNGGNPNSGILDMGNWFRTASPSNNFHDNKLFHNRCNLILNGIIGSDSESNINNFRFVDLKATSGGASSIKSDIIDYLKINLCEVLEYFVSDDKALGLKPHIIVLLGNSAYELFSKYLKSLVLNGNRNLKWVQMPHPSAQTVANDLLKIACNEIIDHLVPIAMAPNKWFCKGRSKSGWRKA